MNALRMMTEDDPEQERRMTPLIKDRATNHAQLVGPQIRASENLRDGVWVSRI